MPSTCLPDRRSFDRVSREERRAGVAADFHRQGTTHDEHARRAARLGQARRAVVRSRRTARHAGCNVIGRTMMKLSGGTFASRVDYDQFLAQARDFQKNYDEKALDRFWADVITSGLSHPFPVWRVSEILQWVESGEYKALMTAPESAAA
jgi:hypothetical protein